MAVYAEDGFYQADMSQPVPIRWSAPESIMKAHFSHKSDVWSFGIVMYETITFGKELYSGATNKEVVRNSLFIAGVGRRGAQRVASSLQHDHCLCCAVRYRVQRDYCDWWNLFDFRNAWYVMLRAARVHISSSLCYQTRALLLWKSPLLLDCVQKMLTLLLPVSTSRMHSGKDGVQRQRALAVP
jgi:serine/threonine protein kinase